ncbi:sodium:solute symporter family transporter [Ferruginivarius sediminum]|uniref:SSS family solute/sodium (Na+) symporter n=1 Tax=Ferruginivarius sediminum TaxID=2661937 RepID=A0A369TBP2_9PROT|nr:sodium/solute symporter [Ferruginivarius sediminum]RDD61815.1 SSS family solute/sodium (Na+) symporter [Ferruginivarius sediminum]
MSRWTAIDLVVIAGYLALVLAVGVWAGRRERDAGDYFLAGRALPWYLIGFSLFASNMSGASFVGLIGASYSHGMVVFNYEWTATLVLIVLAVFMLPVFLRARLFTVPEYLEARFDRRSRWVFALFTIVTLLFIDMAGALYAGGIVISTVFPELGLWRTSAGLAIVAGLYTLVGGLRAVVVTDALQAVLIILGAVLILVFGLREAGGWDAVTDSLDAAKLALIRPADDGFLPWPGILGVLLLGFYYWSLNQYFVQRALAARSLDEGRKGALFGGLLKLPNVFLMVMPGLIALHLFPELENPDRAFPALAFELLPVGLRGLVLTALVAAIMSSLDSAMNAAASLLTMDFVRGLRPRTPGPALLVIGRAFTGLLIVVAALYAPLIQRFGSLFEYFQSTLAYLVPPIVAVYLGGLFIRRLPRSAAFPALLGGLGVGMVLFLVKEVTGLWARLGLPALHFTYMAVGMFALAALLMAAAARAAPAQPPASPAASFQRSDLASDTPGEAWYRDYRYQAAALCLLMLAAIGMFL